MVVDLVVNSGQRKCVLYAGLDPVVVRCFDGAVARVDGADPETWEIRSQPLFLFHYYFSRSLQDMINFFQP